MRIEKMSVFVSGLIPKKRSNGKADAGRSF